MRTAGINLASPAVLRMPKSCARCGRLFGALGREYTCPTCRQPKNINDLESSSRQLSFRERQIVALVREAKANKEIAAVLCLTEGTIKEYIHHIFRKLGVRNRTELALRGDAELVYEYQSPAACREVG
jgi:two-component system, NarL family, nitrate/nitrite response regulator NarL